MSTPIPPPSDPDYNDRPDAPPEPYSYSPAEDSGGCLSIFIGSIGGFVLFFFCGIAVLSLSRRTSMLLVTYMVAALVAAVWLTTKPAARGIAIGIFLGLASALLLISMCSHMNF
jgi:hypothetical protein